MKNKLASIFEHPIILVLGLLAVLKTLGIFDITKQESE